MSKLHWRIFLLRGIAVVTVLFMLLLVVTGLLLNHSTGLGLAQAPVEHRWLRSVYGVPAEAGESEGLVHRLPAGDLSARGGQLRLNDRALGDCPRLVGVVEQAGQILAACSNRLFLLTPEGELIDQADALRGIPDGLSAVGRHGNEVLLRRGESTFSVNLGDLSVAPAVSGTSPPAPALASDAPPGAGVDWERVLLDLHSGRLFGRFGPWFMDAMALLFAVLAASGLVRFWRHRHSP